MAYSSFTIFAEWFLANFLLLIEPPDTSFDRYVLGACGSTSGLARMV